MTGAVVSAVAAARIEDWPASGSFLSPKGNPAPPSAQ